MFALWYSIGRKKFAKNDVRTPLSVFRQKGMTMTQERILEFALAQASYDYMYYSDMAEKTNGYKNLRQTAKAEKDELKKMLDKERGI